MAKIENLFHSLTAENLNIFPMSKKDLEKAFSMFEKHKEADSLMPTCK